MDIAQAETLVDCLKEKNMVFPIPKDIMDSMVQSLSRIEPSGAVTKLPNESFYLAEYPDNLQSDRHQYISFRRLIDNKKVESVSPNMPQIMKDIILDILGAYNSNFYIRDLLGDKFMVPLFNKCHGQYSLLGKLEMIDASTGKDKIKGRPLLIIPNINHITYDWERRYETGSIKRVMV